MVQPGLGNNTSDTPNDHALHVGSKLMPGRDKSRGLPKTAKNIGFGKTHELCQKIVEQMGSDELIALSEGLEDEMTDIRRFVKESGDLEMPEYRKRLEHALKGGLMLCLHIFPQEIKNLKANNLPFAIKTFLEALMKVQGEATQRIEVVKKNWDHVEMKDFLENLPDSTVKEDE